QQPVASLALTWTNPHNRRNLCPLFADICHQEVRRMFPDTLKSRLLATLFFFTVIALTFIFSPSGETSPVVQAFKSPGYCMADGGPSVVYFSAIYDTKLQHPARMSTNVIAREFVEYLKGRYDFSPTGSFPSSCPRFGDVGAAETSKRDFEARARQENKQVVE